MFYNKLLDILLRPIFRGGVWQLLDCLPAWEGNWTNDCYIAFAWQGNGEEKILIAVNYSSGQGQCYVRLPFYNMGGHSWLLRDLIGESIYEREGDDLQAKGLYLDEPAWKIYVFSLDIKNV